MNDDANARLAEIEQRANAAAGGPWFDQPNDLIGGHSVMTSDVPPSQEVGAEIATFISAADAAFIAHARDDVPWLVGQLSYARQSVEILRNDVLRVRDLHRQYRGAGSPPDSCAHCNQIAGREIPWPCPTICALNGGAA